MKGLLCLPILALFAGTQSPEGEGTRTPTTQEGDKALQAAQIAEIRRRAAEDAEARAAELETVAKRLEALATGAAASAKATREKAQAARKAAQAARRLSAEAAAALLRVGGTVVVEGGPGGSIGGASSGSSTGSSMGTEAPVQLPVLPGLALDADKHAAATRTAALNKSLYLPQMRASRAALASRDGAADGYLFPPGEAPDMGDLEIRATGQWAIHVARGDGSFQGPAAGGLAKTGHVDVARLSIRPEPDASGRSGMVWGMRRHNLGDATVSDCDFTDITYEHGIYDNLSGHGLYRGNTFLNLGGQAIQIVHRDLVNGRGPADNLPYTGKPTVILEGNHAVDCGQNARRPGFCWTFFDVGTHEFPSSIVVRDCTAVSAWDVIRDDRNARVDENHPEGKRAAGGLLVHQSLHVRPGAETFAVESFTMDSCLIDMTGSDLPIMALRGIRSIHIEDSCFVARDHRRPVVLVDDLPDRRSGTVVIENCVSPPQHEVWLSIRNERIVPMHCPGKRLTIDVATLAVVESEMKDDPITRLVSPLASRTVRSGIHPQPPGHVDDLGTVATDHAVPPRNATPSRAGASERAPDPPRPGSSGGY